ncbi:MAG TPA: DNA-directed RNA polymerase subunit alpha [Candidatus Paceibacterota bacterium]
MQITLPKKPKVITKDNFKAVIEVEDIYPGYGMTLGNALRRVLLSSLEGAVITMVKIKGVPHEFSTIPSVAEDVMEILLNLKQLRFVLHSSEPQEARLKISGEKTVTAADIECPSQVEVINKSAHIAELTDKGASLDIEMTIEKGFGYVPAEQSKKEKLDVGAIALDAIFTPIRKINYEVEDMRVGDRTDFNRLRVFMETDGTIDPEEAFVKAAKILVEQFAQLTSLGEGQISLMEQEVPVEKEVPKREDTLKTKISELDLSARVINSLEAAGIKTVSGLLRKTETDLLQVEGMGEKAVGEVVKILQKLGLTLKEEKK